MLKMFRFVLIVALFSECYSSNPLRDKINAATMPKSFRRFSGSSQAQNPVEISLYANAWFIQQNGEVINEDGLGNWWSYDSIIGIYFYSLQIGYIDLSLKLKVMTGKSRIMVTIGNTSKKIDITGDKYHIVNVGNFELTKSGYTKVELQGISKTGDFFGDVSHVVVGGDVVKSGKIIYIPDQTDNAYFGRRGPSIHLNYDIPVDDCEYYYNELIVPKGSDIIGSYFMAIGFDWGYFGIQANDNTHRRILFSIWSSFENDDPTKVLDSNKNKLVYKHPNVTTDDFGNEGSGKQSFLEYHWKTDTKYKFLVKATPESGDSTVFTAWFCELNSKWQLIAGWRRPKTYTYLTGFYSFLENFDPDKGFITRKGLYGNQWVCDKSGNWHEIHSALFTGDSTANNNVRLDYRAGTEVINGEEMYYLQNCGFINPDPTIPLRSTLQIKSGKKPQIDLKNLPLN